MMQCACSLVLFDGTPRWRTANVMTSHARGASIKGGSYQNNMSFVIYIQVVHYGILAYLPSEDQGVVNF